MEGTGRWKMLCGVGKSTRGCSLLSNPGFLLPELKVSVLRAPWGHWQSSRGCANTQRSTGQGTGCCFAPTSRTSRGAQSLRAPTAELRGAGLQNPGGLHQQKQARGAQQPPRVPPGISSHCATGTGDGATDLGWLRLAAAGSG